MLKSNKTSVLFCSVYIIALPVTETTLRERHAPLNTRDTLICYRSIGEIHVTRMLTGNFQITPLC